MKRLPQPRGSSGEEPARQSPALFSETGDDRGVGSWKNRVGDRVAPPPVSPAPSPTPAEQGWIVSALRRRWKIIALETIACLLVIIPLAATQAPTYTAKSRLIVRASAGVPPQNAPDFLEAAESLAATYSRAVTAEFVLGPLSRDTGLTRSEIISRLSASPVPESSVFFIEATGPTEQGAIDLANRATKLLLKWISETNADDRAGDALIDEITAAASAAARAQERESELRAVFAASATEANARAVEQARAQRLAAEARLEGLRSVYAETRLAHALGHVVTVLNPPTQAASDRSSTIQKLFLIGLLGGLLAGCGLALIVDRLRPRFQVERTFPRSAPTETPTDVARPGEAIRRRESEG
jgi:capsular polysaccharide biosynthesis protein